jgi:hypothetical protein
MVGEHTFQGTEQTWICECSLKGRPLEEEA